jgi:hypothetical protein
MRYAALCVVHVLVVCVCVRAWLWLGMCRVLV